MARTWVVAADAARARIFESEKRSGASMQERETWVNPELRLPAQELVTDEPGRGGGASGERHAIDPSADLKEVEAERFARELAQWLERARQRGQFDYLLVAAEPHFLGQLRHRMGGALRATITHEIDKDLCRLERPDQVRKHLPDFLY